MFAGRGAVMTIVMVMLSITVPVPATLSAQDRGTLRFVNATPFAVRIVAGSGRVDVCALPPHGEQTVQSSFGRTEYFYPVFDVPLTARFLLRDTRPADRNFFYQMDDSRGQAAVTIDAVPVLADTSSYIVLVNTSGTGGVSAARTASSRLSRLDAGGSDNVNAGESGVFRINPTEDNMMRVSSPLDVPFPEVAYRPGYRYVFVFDGARVTLIDARPLHRIGQPLAASVRFDGIPDGERPALAAALDGALAANNAPLRIPAERSGDTADGEVRYVFTLALVAQGAAAQPLGGIALHSGDVTLNLSRNGAVLSERKAVVTEFDEAGLYRALRRLIVGETQWYRELAEKTGVP
jgi:hypothetical protein